MSMSLFRADRRPIKSYQLHSAESNLLLNVGTVIPVNPLNSGDMLLVNTCYQMRNAMMALKNANTLTNDMMSELLYQVRGQHNFNLQMTETVKWLCETLEESKYGTATTSDWCKFGSQALHSASTLCYAVPEFGAFFASLFKTTATLVDWYGEYVLKEDKIDNFDVRRTAYFDNLPNFSSASELGLSLSKLEEAEDKLNLINQKLVDVDGMFYESEKWLLENKQIDRGLNFYGLIDSEGIICPNKMGVAFPVITSGEKSIYWSAIDALSKTCNVGAISCNSTLVKKNVDAMVTHHLMGNDKKIFKLVKRSNTTMFSLDDEMVTRLYDLKKFSSYLSDDNDRCMGQIHGFLQLGGGPGEAD
ncbi:MAG: hypothetical protein 4 [Bactrocera dorsalis orbivirus isolate Zt]|nr:MAG: hypothetical protein 4 [Bactrocera dorsalis orbivirus isolate Zt]